MIDTGAPSIRLAFGAGQIVAIESAVVDQWLELPPWGLLNRIIPMKWIIARVATHLPSAIGLLVGLAIFSFFFGDFVRTKNWFTDDLLGFLAPTALGSATGALLGGFAGWTVGGIGIAAMGTAVGLSLLPVIAVGALVGVLAGGFFGSGVTLFKVLTDPGGYVIDYAGLSALLVACVAAGLVTRAILLRVVRWRVARATQEPVSD